MTANGAAYKDLQGCPCHRRWSDRVHEVIVRSAFAHTLRQSSSPLTSGSTSAATSTGHCSTTSIANVIRGIRVRGCSGRRAGPNRPGSTRSDVGSSTSATRLSGAPQETATALQVRRQMPGRSDRCPPRIAIATRTRSPLSSVTHHEIRSSPPGYMSLRSARTTSWPATTRPIARLQLYQSHSSSVTTEHIYAVQCAVFWPKAEECNA